MIVEALLNAIQSMLFAVFSFINLPSLPENVVTRLYEFIDLFEYASQFIAFFVPPSVSSTLYPIWFGLFSIDKLYPIVMWVIRKIPVSIS